MLHGRMLACSNQLMENGTAVSSKSGFSGSWGLRSCQELGNRNRRLTVFGSPNFPRSPDPNYVLLSKLREPGGKLEVAQESS